MALFANPYALTFLPGMRVRAVARITESDEPHDPTAGPCEDGWLHCEPGDLGTVGTVGEFGPTVYFDTSGTGTLCDPLELELVVEEATNPSDVPFPQANTVAKVIESVRYVDCGVTTADKLSRHLGMVKREAAYYADAAAYLGFVTRSGGEYVLTKSGQLLVAADAVTARALMVASMSTAPGIRWGMEYVKKYGALPSIFEVQRWVQRFGGVHGETRKRRAECVLAWLKWALDGRVDEADYFAA